MPKCFRDKLDAKPSAVKSLSPIPGGNLAPPASLVPTPNRLPGPEPRLSGSWTGNTLWPMRFSTGMPGLTRYPPGYSPEWAMELTSADFQQIARRSEELGYDSINIPEHIVMPDDLAPAMGAYWPSAPTAMSFVAGATTRVQANSCLIVLPYHNPIVLAKTVATLDVMSGGRVMLTFGVGHAENEFKSLGVPFHRRGRITDEYVEAMVALWTEEAPSYLGEFVQFDGIRFEPKPVQRPYPPIWFGGNSSAALRRVARYGTGWMPWLVTPEELPGRLDELRQMPGYGERGGRRLVSPIAHSDP